MILTNTSCAIKKAQSRSLFEAQTRKVQRSVGEGVRECVFGRTMLPVTHEEADQCSMAAPGGPVARRITDLSREQMPWKKKNVHTPQTQQKTRFLSLFVLYFVCNYNINRKVSENIKKSKTVWLKFDGLSENYLTFLCKY